MNVNKPLYIHRLKITLSLVHTVGMTNKTVFTALYSLQQNRSATWVIVKNTNFMS